MASKRLVLSLLFMAIALSAYGQSLPMPSIWWDQTGQMVVWPIGVHENMMEIENWLKYLRVEVDTNRADIDTIQADIDTLFNQGDSLHTRIDSCIHAMTDSVFYACDTAGGTQIGPASFESLVFDKEIRKDGIYGHDADGAAVCLLTAGDYLCSYTISVESLDNAETFIKTYLSLYTTSWTNLQGSKAYAYIAANDPNYVAVSGNALLSVSANDSIRLRVQTGGAGIETMENSVSLYIEKKH